MCIVSVWRKNSGFSQDQQQANAVQHVYILASTKSKCSHAALINHQGVVFMLLS